MINTSYEDNFTFLRRQQQQAAEHNRERLRASPAAQSNSSQHHHASATSLSSEESAFLVPRPKPSSPKEVSASDAVDNASKSSQPIKKYIFIYFSHDLLVNIRNNDRYHILIHIIFQ